MPPSKPLSSLWLLAPVSLLLALSLSAQTAAHIESPQEFITRLTPPQRAQFDTAVKAFNARQFADALTVYKALLNQLPDDTILAKYASDDALNVGDTAFAVAALKPIALANPSDWQATSLLVRACAESGDAPCRDAGIAHMLDLHTQGVIPSALQEYIVEHTEAGANHLVIWASLEPLGRNKSYLFAQVSDSKGNILLQITLESSDQDMKRVATFHAYDASLGRRGFSIHSYAISQPDKSGQRTQTATTYNTYTGQPTYTEVRDQFIRIASGKAHSDNIQTARLAAQPKP